MREDDKNGEMEAPINQTNKIDTQTEIQGNKLKSVQFKLPADMVHKIRCYCYWERITHQQFFDDVVNNFFKEKNIEDIPESVKNRCKAGRKRKF